VEQSPGFSAAGKPILIIENRQRAWADWGLAGSAETTPRSPTIPVGGPGGARCEGLMTHFASAADYDSLQNDHQAAAFSTCDAASIWPELAAPFS